jgi:tetratricopeptide (TPR) repeat protein
MPGEPEDPPAEAGLASSRGRVEMDVVESRVHERLFGAPIRRVTIGRFEVLGPVGAGGMGVVFVAHDPELDRRVAIKLVAQGLVRSTVSSQSRLLAEARTMARLSHPNIVQVHDVGAFEGGVYVAMEYIDGETLEHWLKRRRQPHWAEIVAVFVQAGRGLAAGHAQGVVHRDFKPANAMIDRSGHVRVLDFGLAIDDQMRDDAEPVSGGPSASSHRGTPLYMAPELRAGGHASTGSDQYAFCVSLWRALYSAPPGSRSPADRDSVPTWLRRALLRGLADSPHERWPAMQPLLDALEKGQVRTRRRRLRAGVIALLGISALALWGLGDEPRPDATDCHGFEVAAARAWDPAARRSIDEVLGGIDDNLAVQVVLHLDAYAEDLRVARASACAEAAHGRLQCLDREERELASTIERLGRARTDTVAAASMAIAELEAPSRCGTADLFDEGEDPDVAQLLADSRVSLRAGLVRESYATTTLACARLSGREQTVQWAHCQLQLGDALFTLGRHEEASTALEQAHLAATRLDRPSIGVPAAELATRSAMLLGRPEDARRWLGNLRVHVTRLQDPAARVAVAIVESELLANEHRYPEALAIHDELDKSGLLERSSVSRQLSARLRAARYRGRTGDAAGSERELATATELADRLPESHALVGATHAIRGQHLQQIGRFEDALAEYRITVELASRYRSPDDSMAADASGAIAESLLALGRLDEALVVADENVRRAEIAHAGTRILPFELLARAQINRDLGDAAAAERDGVAALTLADARRDGDDIAATAHVLLATTSLDLGRLDDARTHAEQAIAELGRILGPEHPDTLGAHLALANVESSAGNIERAIELSLRARDGFVAAVGPDHPEVAHASYIAGLALERAGRRELALVELERSLAVWHAAFGEEHPDTRDAQAAVERVRRSTAP